VNTPAVGGGCIEVVAIDRCEVDRDELESSPPPLCSDDSGGSEQADECRKLGGE
jgi:hypothetical protein